MDPDLRYVFPSLLGASTHLAISTHLPTACSISRLKIHTNHTLNQPFFLIDQTCASKNQYLLIFSISAVASDSTTASSRPALAGCYSDMRAFKYGNHGEPMDGLVITTIILPIDFCRIKLFGFCLGVPVPVLSGLVYVPK
jgi:hypothetical protein